jgi:hypothetical protein
LIETKFTHESKPKGPFCSDKEIEFGFKDFIRRLLPGDDVKEARIYQKQDDANFGTPIGTIDLTTQKVKRD